MAETSSQSSSPGVIKTVLEVDLVSYADIARALEETLNVEAVRNFEDQIQAFVDHGLATVGLRRRDIVLGTAGDNAILIFDDAATMHVFAEAVQIETLAHNSDRSIELAKRWFRMGAATGLVQILPERRIVGTTIARAVRLEAAAAKGQLLVDTETFATLPENLKQIYGSEEIISGKRDEKFRGHRCTFIQVPPPTEAHDKPVPGAKGRPRARPPTEGLLAIYDLYRTCYLNQKYYGFRLTRLDDSASDGTGNADRHSRVRIQNYKNLFKEYSQATSILRYTVEEIRVKKRLPRKAMNEYRRIRELVAKLEMMDEPNPDRGLIRRFQREVNQEIPPRVLWFPTNE